MLCTFIGHRDTPDCIEPLLKSTVLNLIKKHDVNNFYLGNNGNFDAMALKVLKEFEKIYKINYSLVLPYYPKTKDSYLDYSKTVLPDDIEKTPPKFALIKRNKWMIDKCDYLICYVTQDITNSYNFMKLAEKKEKNNYKSCKIIVHFTLLYKKSNIQ